MNDSIVNDTRIIKAIWKEEDGYQIGGTSGITKIEVYQETGQMAYVPWAKIWKGDFLLARVDLAGWIVIYKED